MITVHATLDIDGDLQRCVCELEWSAPDYSVGCKESVDIVTVTDELGRDVTEIALADPFAVDQIKRVYDDTIADMLFSRADY